MINELFVLVLLVFINAFFAASEIALISLNDNKIKLLADEGNKKARMLKNLLSEPSRFLATIQIGITLAGFLASAYASESFADRLVNFVLSTGVQVPQDILKGIAVAVITIVLAYFTLVFGELVPKRLAMQKSEEISMFAIGPLNFLSVVTYPFVKLLTASTNFFIRLFGGNPNADEEKVTEEEIRMMVDVGEEKGTIHEIEKEFINNVFEFDDKVASDIMTHRTEIAAIPIDAKLERIVNLISSEKYTRIPVYEDSIDNIIGILNVKDLVPFTMKNNNQFDLMALLRKPNFVPDSKKLSDLFKELQKNKTHMVVVIDEYGGTAGIITIEDVLEEIVGNIFDEYDEEEFEFKKIDDNTYLFDGSISLDTVEELIDMSLPVEEYDTLSGYVIGQLGKIPNKGEQPLVELENFVFKVEEVEEKRIVRIKVCRA